MAVTHVRYEVEGWGVGELWTAGRCVAWHEPPRVQGGPSFSPDPGWGSFDPPPSESTLPLESARSGDEAVKKGRAYEAVKIGRADEVVKRRKAGEVVPEGKAVEFLPDLIQRLQAFFAGEPVEFSDVELDLEEHSAFHLACVDVLRRLPRGEVVTYGELAALAGRPGAARAAGTFCARNRLSILVPCHRVVAAGGIGSYGSLGVGYKRRLLELEDVVL